MPSPWYGAGCTSWPNSASSSSLPCSSITTSKRILSAEQVTSRTHFLTVVAQRVDYLLPRDDPAKANRRLRGLSLCDPGGLLYRSGNQVVKVLVERLMKARWSEVEILSELERGEEEE